MASIYAGAERVLVLDAELMTTESTTRQQSMAKVLCSDWMRRSWTLQEGILAKRCYFVFANKIHTAKLQRGSHAIFWFTVGYRKNKKGSRSAGDAEATVLKQRGIWRRWRQSILLRAYLRMTMPSDGRDEISRENLKLSTLIGTSTNVSVQRALSFWFRQDFFRIRMTDCTMCERFVFVWTALQNRTTTQREDLYFIVGNLLGISDPHSLAAKPRDERIPSIVFSLDMVPLSLFFNVEPRMCESRYPWNRWVPTELSEEVLSPSPSLSFRDSDLHLHGRPHHATPAGFSICLVRAAIPSFLTQFILHCNDRAWTVHASTETMQSPDLGQGQTIIIIEDPAPASTKKQRAAIFHVSSWTNDGKKDIISLIFRNPARMVLLATEAHPISKETKTSHTCIGKLISTPVDISVMYSK